MASEEARCAVVSVLVSDHKWGTPLKDEELIRRTAHENDGEIKEAIDELKQKVFILYSNARGMMIDSSHFGALADYLFNRCCWRPFVIKSRLKHYEGWNEHSWSKNG